MSFLILRLIDRLSRHEIDILSCYFMMSPLDAQVLIVEDYMLKLNLSHGISKHEFSKMSSHKKATVVPGFRIPDIEANSISGHKNVRILCVRISSSPNIECLVNKSLLQYA